MLRILLESVLPALATAGGVAWASYRKFRTQPSLRISDATMFVDAAGKSQGQLWNIIKHLEEELEDERALSDAQEIRIRKLERAMRKAGLDPDAIDGPTT